MQRPFNFTVVADQHGWITVTFERPCGDELPAGLADRAKLNEFAFHCESRFLSELASRCIERTLVRLVLAFRNRPRAEILLHPIRTSGMNQENFNASRIAAIKQYSCASFGHGCILRKAASLRLKS